MDYQVRSASDIEKERTAQGVWPVGEYSFEILPDAVVGQSSFYTEERKSQSGNDMFQLCVLVVHPTGVKRVLRDYLMPSNPVKLYDACVACGLVEDYNAKTLRADKFIGKRGTVRLGIEKGKDGYEDKNNVRGYLLKATAQTPVSETPVSMPSKPELVDDEVPFAPHLNFIGA